MCYCFFLTFFLMLFFSCEEAFVNLQEWQMMLHLVSGCILFLGVLNCCMRSVTALMYGSVTKPWFVVLVVILFCLLFSFASVCFFPFDIAQGEYFLDNRLQERKRERNSRPGDIISRFPSTGDFAAPLPASESSPEPMQLGWAGLTKEEQTHRRTANLCLYCGKPGHYIATCPTKKKPWLTINLGANGESDIYKDPPALDGSCVGVLERTVCACGGARGFWCRGQFH